jgi:hypothetical protein
MSDLESIFNDLVAERGGAAAFNSAQIAIAGELAQLMFETPSLSAGERIKRAELMCRLSALLPTVEVRARPSEFTIDADTAAAEIAAQYALVIRGEVSWVLTDEYAKSRAALRRLQDDSDVLTFLRARLSEQDFDAWLKLLQEMMESDAAAGPAEAAAIAPLVEMPRYPAERPGASVGPVEIIPPDHAAGPVDPRLRAGFSYFRLSPEQRREIEAGA